MLETSDTLERSASVRAPSAPPAIDVILFLVLLGVYWAILFNQLRVDWSINPQYFYGWAVPLLAIGLFQMRWASRPEPAAPRSSVFAGLLAAAAIAALLPIRLAEEANPEWRMALWAHGAQMALITGCALYAAGGWPWVRHWAFPTLFILVAIPWPMWLEQNLIQSLMRDVAAVTAELADDFLGIPAMEENNVIHISTGLVGIDEACSGVRSVQTTFFASLFLGELYRFSVVRRVLLVAGGMAIALGANVARTTTLVWIAARHGLEPMRHWHDTVGGWALVVTLLGIWALAIWPRNRRKIAPERPASESGIRALPRPVLVACAVWILAAETGTQWWYWSHESKLVENSRWSINWPVGLAGYKETPIDDTVHSMLRYTEGTEAVWRDDNANHWILFLFRWAPGRNSVQLARTHTPDICLTGAGFHLDTDLGLRRVNAQGLVLPVRQSVFSHDSEPPLYVFYCLWEERGAQDGAVAPGNGVINFASRMAAIRAGERHLGQQVLEVAVRGPSSPEEAAALFDRQIGKLIQR